MRRASKIIIWIILIVLSVLIGVGLASRRHNNQAGSATVSTNTSAETGSDTETANSASNTDVATNSTATNAAVTNTGTAVTNSQPAKVTVPALESISYQAQSAEEEAIVNAVKTFYGAYNTGNKDGLIAQFDLSVAVTKSVETALAEGIARPYKVGINKISVRSDGSSVVEVTETRSNNQTYGRELELFPNGSTCVLVAYRANNDASDLSGFGG